MLLDTLVVMTDSYSLGTKAFSFRSTASDSVEFEQIHATAGVRDVCSIYPLHDSFGLVPREGEAAGKPLIRNVAPLHAQVSA